MPRARRPAHGRRDRRGQPRRPRAEERPGRLRAGDGGRPRRRADAPGRARRAAATSCRTGTHLFQFAASSRSSAAGAARCAAPSARWYAAQPAGRARLPGGQVPPARRRHAPRPAPPRPPGRRSAPATRARGHATSTRACSSGSSAAARPTACRAWSRASPARRRRRRPREAAALVREYRLPREALRPRAPHLAGGLGRRCSSDMPMTALIRNLATMTRVGVLAPGSDGTAQAVARSATRSGIRRARVHPIAVLAALRTYASGRGLAAAATWNPVRRGRRRARRRVLRGVRQRRAGRQAAAARARRVGLDDRRLRRRRAGPHAARRLGGAGAGHGRDGAAVRDRRLHRRQRRLEAAAGPLVGLRRRPHAAGDLAAAAAGRRGQDGVATCRSAAPTARCRCCTRRRSEREVDTFVIYTDSETWAGDIHPAQALRDYRARRASTRGWSWSAWSRTASRSPTRPTRACSTSSDSTPRRRSSSPTSPAARSERSAPRGGRLA